MSEAIGDGLRFMNGDDPQSPPEVGLSHSRSTSPDNSDSNSNKGSRKRGGTSEKRVANKVCRVCGDKAFSYNFNVITCESCKAFFRRNANKGHEIRCPFNENCEITKLSRRFCQKCRLTKCFDVGMKKEWIMSDEARLEKKARVEENRERRMQEALAKSGQGGRATLQSNNNNHIRRPSESIQMEEPPNVSGYQPMEIDDYSNPPPTSPPLSVYHREYPPTAQPINIYSGSMPELPLCSTSPLSHGFLDTVTTSSAHALSDSTAVAGTLSGLQNSPTMTHTMSKAGFRPPTLHETGAVNPTIQHDALAVSAIAHAQLAVAAQAQVQLQQQAQQMAQVAAVVAATIPPAAAILQQPLTQTPIPPIPTPMPQAIAPSLPTVSISHVVSAAMVPAPPLDNGLVTIPRDVFFRLVKGVNNPLKKEKCVCSCLCGRYSPGTTIVNEVTKYLLSSRIIQCNNCEGDGSDKCDPATLETKADLQMNGLLPSEQSSVNWLNSNLPISDTIVDTFGHTNDTFYSNPSLLEVEIRSVNVDPDCCIMVSHDHDRLNELVAANKVTWGMQLEATEKIRHEGHCADKEGMVNMADGAIRRLIKMSKRIEAFRNLPSTDQIALIRGNCMDYLILRGVMAYDPNQNVWRGRSQDNGYNIKTDTTLTEENVFEHSIRFYSTFKEDHRTNESIMLLLGQLIIFNSDNIKLEQRDVVCNINAGYKRCLKRLLFTLSGGDGNQTMIDFRNLIDKLTTIKEMNRRATAIIREVNSNFIEPLILEMLEEPNLQI